MKVIEYVRPVKPAYSRNNWRVTPSRRLGEHRRGKEALELRPAAQWRLGIGAHYIRQDQETSDKACRERLQGEEFRGATELNDQPNAT